MERGRWKTRRRPSGRRDVPKASVTCQVRQRCRMLGVFGVMMCCQAPKPANKIRSWVIPNCVCSPHQLPRQAQLHSPDKQETNAMFCLGGGFFSDGAASQKQIAARSEKPGHEEEPRSCKRLTENEEESRERTNITKPIFPIGRSLKFPPG
ncbi:hypothetical protein GGR50DRAFT_629179 [Xylaria sp. CBS 124048]|nr:hypothetical protein GGR50DRAFT_629179 [Xylaria sp. CBS 124048]